MIILEVFSSKIIIHMQLILNQKNLDKLHQYTNTAICPGVFDSDVSKDQTCFKGKSHLLLLKVNCKIILFIFQNPQMFFGLLHILYQSHNVAFLLCPTFFCANLSYENLPLFILPKKCSYQINVGFKAAAFQFNLTQVHHHEQEVCCLSKSCFSSFCNEYVKVR